MLRRTTVRNVFLLICFVLSFASSVLAGQSAQTYTLTLSVVGGSNDFITLNNVTSDGRDALGCLGGSTCTFTFFDGTSVNMTAVTADPSSYVQGWAVGLEGSCMGNTGNCSVSMDMDRKVIVTFDTVKTLKINNTSSGGSVVINNLFYMNGDVGPICGEGSVCTYKFPTKTKIEMVAVPKVGYVVDSWLNSSKKPICENGTSTIFSGTTTCSYSLATDSSVIVGFTPINSVKIDYGTQVNFYATFTEAVNTAMLPAGIGSHAIWQSQDAVYQEDVIIPSYRNLWLQGGYSKDFTNRTGYTVINGKMTIEGSVVADKLVIK